MKKTVRSVVKAARRYDLAWRYGFNLVPSLQYRLSAKPELASEEQRVLHELNACGIAMSSVEALFDKGDLFTEMVETVSGLLADREAELDKLRSLADDTAKVGTKAFNVELLGGKPMFELTSVFARFALQQALLNIANAYFGMRVKLRYYNVWYNFATRSEARESQLWHQDREDLQILKVFVYLKDVDENTGALSYAPRTHRKGALCDAQPEFFLEQRVQRSTDDQMAAAVPSDSWIRACGRAGTVVFADTHGFHKGGEVREGDRLVYTVMFTSAASDSPKLLSYPVDLAVNGITLGQRAALEVF
jgi:hypothetical protein